jgi:GNAT superfamily N-acetyltransferase
MITMTTTGDCGPVLEVGAEPWLLLPDVSVAPLARGDVRTVRQVFDGLSPTSRQMRFLAGVPYLAPDLADKLAEVDHEFHGCWVARLGGRPVGIGRYIRTTRDPALAEVAFEVVDAYQGHGLGRLLLAVVGAAAADAGVTSLLWLMDEANRPVRKLAAPLGGRFALEYGVLEGTTALPDVAPLDAAAIARCARIARRCAAGSAAA